MAGSGADAAADGVDDPFQHDGAGEVAGGGHRGVGGPSGCAAIHAEHLAEDGLPGLGFATEHVEHAIQDRRAGGAAGRDGGARRPDVFRRIVDVDVAEIPGPERPPME